MPLRVAPDAFFNVNVVVDGTVFTKYELPVVGVDPAAAALITASVVPSEPTKAPMLVVMITSSPTAKP